MQITFNPHDDADLAVIARLLGSTAVTPAQPTPAQPTPVAAQEPEYGPDEMDCHGMTWDAEIHSTPPAKNADGSWRARRGRKDQYDAAIAAHLAAQTAPEQAHTAPEQAQTAHTAPEPDVTVTHSPEFVEAAAQVDPAPAQPTPVAPTTMPQPAGMPSAPQAPVTYKQMAERFLSKFNQPRGAVGGLPVSHEQVYADLGIVNAADPTNQTNIDRCWYYMDALDEGMTHADAVRHARGLA